jgi:arylsulfatase A-like enzyme
MDREVGRIVATLDELGLTYDTIFVFSSDNGATFPGAGGVVTDRMKSNGMLRDWKGSPYEGGLRVPAVVVWPGRIAAGASIDTPTGCEDWLPTLLDLAAPDAPRPAILDGQSLAEALLGRSPPPTTRTLYRELTERLWQTAIEVSPNGCWKAVRRGLGREMSDRAAPMELYDLVADPAEADDVSAARPDVALRMERLLDREHRPDPAWPLPFADAATARARGADRIDATDGIPSAKP